jgi:hypothetical protein
MIPKNKRADFKEPDKLLEMELDMNVVRVHLRDGRKNLALLRALPHVQPKPGI